MKVGDVVVCILPVYGYLTVDKKYKILDYNGDMIHVFDDSGVRFGFHDFRFKALKEFREKKLKRILK